MGIIGYAAVGGLLWGVISSVFIIVKTQHRMNKEK